MPLGVPLTSVVVPVDKSRRKTLLARWETPYPPEAPDPPEAPEPPEAPAPPEVPGPPAGGVGSRGLLVRSVALLVKASSLPSGLKTGSVAMPSDCSPLGVALTK